MTLADSGSTTEPVSAAATPQVEIKDGLITADIRDAAVGDVLHAIAEQAGFDLRIRGELSRRMTWSLTNVRMEKVIRELVGDHGVVMLFAPSGRGGRPTLAEVRVYGSWAGPVVRHVAAPKKAPLERVYANLPQRERATRMNFVRDLAQGTNVRATEDLESVLANERDSVVRRVAAMGLAELGGTEAITALSRAADDSDPLVRVVALRGLANAGGPGAAEFLLDSLQDRNGSVRIQALVALQDVSAAGWEDALGDVLVNDEEPKVRRVAVRTLEKLHTYEAWVLLHQATDDPDAKVRSAVLSTLSRW